MILIYMLLFLSLVIGVTALFWKLAARILSYGGVTWPLALLTAATIVCALGVSISIAIGAWCFHDRATHPDGKPVDWPGAFKLSGVAVGLNALLALLLIAAAMTVDAQSQ